MLLVLILALIVLCKAELLPCTTPEDREIAAYAGGVCRAAYNCCFTEEIENETKSCCYSYTAHGLPYKCCGYNTSFMLSFIIIIALLFTAIVFLCFAIVYRPEWRCDDAAIEPVFKEGVANNDLPLDDSHLKKNK